MRNICLLYLLLLIGLFSCSNNNCDKNLRPNIVLIMVDDMGYECIGANGNIEYETPNIDHLAQEGLRFDRCYSQPLCTPSRVKIMTGKFNYRNYEDFGYLNPNQKTFGNLLQDAGYATCIAGKWQLNGLNRNNEGNQDVTRPNHFGFDEYCLWQLNRKGREGGRFANPLITQNGSDLERNPDAYGPQIFTDYICDFIDRNAEKPFFVYYPMVLVHTPFVPTPDSPQWDEPQRRYEHDTTYFKDMVAYTDKLVGQIKAKLIEKGVWKNTLFIFTADNGTKQSIVSSTNYGKVRGAKGETINTGNHVPLILTWPKIIKEKREVNAVVSFADILPTFCEVAQIETSEYSTDGTSFLPVITNQKEAVQEKAFIHYTPRWGSGKNKKLHNRWVMDGKYKLYRDGRFYNTSVDTLEKTPLVTLSEKEIQLKNEFQKVLDEKQQEFPYSFNDKTFKSGN